MVQKEKIKALITGIKGFAGSYLKTELKNEGYEVFGIAREGSDDAFQCDLTNFKSILAVVDKVKPNYIFHLAGFSSSSKSFNNAELCFKTNVDGTKNLLDAVIKVGLKPRILLVSSAEVYGKPNYIPTDEQHPLNPLSPYGKSKVEQEKLALSYDLPIIIARPFNHTGPGQDETRIIPYFNKKIEEVSSGEVIKVGNLEVIRDISNVKDVVKIYRLLLEKGKEKEIYNVGSGKGHYLKKILNTLIEKSGKKIRIEIDSERIRPVDIPYSVCDNRKLRSLLKIKPKSIKF